MLRKASYWRRAATQSPAAWWASMSALLTALPQWLGEDGDVHGLHRRGRAPGRAQQPAERLQGVQQPQLDPLRGRRAPSRRTSRGSSSSSAIGPGSTPRLASSRAVAEDPGGPGLQAREVDLDVVAQAERGLLGVDQPGS